MGALRASFKIENQFNADGSLAARLAIGYFDGKRSYIAAFMKNRKPGQCDFNRKIAAYTFDGPEIHQ